LGRLRFSSKFLSFSARPGNEIVQPISLAREPFTASQRLSQQPEHRKQTSRRLYQERLILHHALVSRLNTILARHPAPPILFGNSRSGAP